MNKRVTCLMLFIMFFNAYLCEAVDSDKDKFQLSLNQSTLVINEGSVSNFDYLGGSSNHLRKVTSKGASLNLVGVGLRYYPAETIFIDLDSQSLLNKQAVASFDDGVLKADIMVNHLTKISLIVQKLLQIDRKLAVTGGLGFAFISSDLFENSIGVYNDFWSEHYSMCLKAGIDYTFTKRLQGSIGVSYYVSPTIEYHQFHNTVGQSVNTFTIPIFPLSIEAKLLFDI